MICLDDTDLIQGDADNATEVDYTIHGLVGSTFTVLGDGQLPNAKGTLYNAGAAISVVCVTLVNTGAAAQAVNLYLDSAAGGNSRRMIPKDVSLGIGYSLHFDGQRISIMDTTGGIAYSYIAHTHDGDTLQLDGVNSDGGAFAFTTSGAVTFSQNIAMANAKGIDFSATDSGNILDYYKKGTYTATLACGTSGTITLDLAQDDLAYTKVGRQVTITGYVVVDSVSSPVGSLSLNLPFTCANLAGRAGYSTGLMSHFGIVALTNVGVLVVRMSEGSASAEVREITTTGNVNDVANHAQAGATLYFGFSYFTA